MNNYFRVGNIFYELSTGACISVNVGKNSIRKLKVLPSVDVKNVSVITERDFNEAKKAVESIINWNDWV